MGAGGVTGAPVDRALTVDEVRAFFERWVGAQEDAQLAVGKVEEQDDDTVIVEIVSKGEGGSVRRYAVDRHTGSYRPADG